MRRSTWSLLFLAALAAASCGDPSRAVAPRPSLEKSRAKVAERALPFNSLAGASAAALSVRSLRGDEPTTIRFVNHRCKGVRVNWIDYQGNVVYYANVKPGRQLLQATYATHPWMISVNEGRERLGFFVAIERPGLATIPGAC